MIPHTRQEKMARALLRPINPATVVLLGGYTVVWGLWIASPFWDVFGRAELYGILALVAPEWFWGVLAIVCGAATCIGAIKRSYRPLVTGAVVSGWHWMMISILYFLGDPLSTGGITALTLAIYSAYLYLNIRLNFKDDHEDPTLLE